MFCHRLRKSTQIKIFPILHTPFNVSGQYLAASCFVVWPSVHTLGHKIHSKGYEVYHFSASIISCQIQWLFTDPLLMPELEALFAKEVNNISAILFL